MLIEDTIFSYFVLGKTFQKQVKTIEEQGQKQVKAIEEQGEKQLDAPTFVFIVSWLLLIMILKNMIMIMIISSLTMIGMKKKTMKDLKEDF